MNPIQRFVGRITEFFVSNFTEPIYSRVRTITRRWRSSFRQPNTTWARSDYDYYKRLYRGQVRGLELAGLLTKPIVSKLSSWTLGRAPRWKLDSETSQQALGDWWNDHHPDILAAWRSALKEADAFFVINSDLSLTLLPPDSVDPIVADDDFGNIIGWRVTQVLTHPETTLRMTVEDEYYADRRIHRVTIDGVRRDENTFPNLLGRIPLIHIANQADAGEVFGHAEAEALLPLFHKYGEVFEAAIEGNVLQGRPTPVLTFATVADLEKFDDENATFETQQLPDGTSQRVKTYEVDLSQLLVASGAEFKYESPGNFTADTAQLLEILFYLILEHSELPEFVFGNAISSSKASAETQLPIFLRFVEARRGEMARWMIEIAEIALGYLALTTPGVATATPILQWEPLDQQDGTLTLETIKWAYMEGLIDELTALQLMPVEIEDAEAVLAKAKEERAEREAQQQDADEQAAGVVQSVLDRVRQNGNTNGNGNGNGANLPVNGRERAAA
jgi:hypothetical protein